jgi:urea transporter
MYVASYVSGVVSVVGVAWSISLALFSSRLSLPLLLLLRCPYDKAEEGVIGRYVRMYFSFVFHFSFRHRVEWMKVLLQVYMLEQTRMAVGLCSRMQWPNSVMSHSRAFCRTTYRRYLLT